MTKKSIHIKLIFEAFSYSITLFENKICFHNYQ